MTDTKPPRASHPLRLTPLELRLYAAAILAAVYLVTWRAIAPGAAAAAGATAMATPTGGPATSAAPGGPVAVWLDELPAARRPPLALPAGWRVASRRGATAPVPALVRAPASRPLRVRTRSS